MWIHYGGCAKQIFFFVFSGFLHAHVSYLSDDCQACLLLLTVDHDLFFVLSEAKQRIVEVNKIFYNLSRIVRGARKPLLQVVQHLYAFYLCWESHKKRLCRVLSCLAERQRELRCTLFARELISEEQIWWSTDRFTRSVIQKPQLSKVWRWEVLI